MNYKIFLFTLLVLQFTFAAKKLKDSTITALVLPCSYNTQGYPVWNNINQNSRQYGEYDVFVNASIAYLRSFSYNDLIGADVLILSDNTGIGCYLSAQEITDLEDYLFEGHTLIGTYVIFDSAEVTVESLFGFSAMGSFTSSIGSSTWVSVNPSSLTNNLGSSWTAKSYAGSVNPTAGWSTVAADAEIIYQNTDKTGVITVYSPGYYNAIYISYMPEYTGQQNDTQLLYNAITYGFDSGCSQYTSCKQCAGADSQCAWCLDDSTCISDSSQCRSFIHNPQYCPSTDCSQYSTCDTCLSGANSEDCDWCLDSQTCISNSDTSSCDDAINDSQYCNLK